MTRRIANRWFALSVALLCIGLAATLAVLALGSLESAGTAAPQRSAETVKYRGINLGQGGFAPKRIPGRYGFDYLYPLPKEAAPFTAAGMNAVRVPVLWERMQPAAMAPLVESEMKRIDRSLEGLGKFELIILNVHNYARYRGKLLDTASGPAQLADLWTKLAKRYGSNPRIAFGIMNEPHGISGPDWRIIGEASLKAIRDTGAKNLILMSGTRWSSAYQWPRGPESSGVAFAGMRDPANNLAYEMHQYFDENSSGTGTECISPDRAKRRLEGATAWLRENKARGFLGEFATPGDPECLATLTAVLDELEGAGDAWLGWTWWAAGDWWGTYPFNLTPTGGKPRPQMEVLARHLGTGRSNRR